MDYKQEDDMESNVIEPAYYKSQDLAVMFNFSMKAISRFAMDHRLPGMLKIGHEWRYDKRAVDAARRSGCLLLPKQN